MTERMPDRVFEVTVPVVIIIFAGALVLHFLGWL